MSDPNEKRALMEQEEREWTELHGLVDAMPADQVEEPGYFVEGWSAKDLIGHIGSWLAEAGVVLEQIRAGTYRPEEIDIDEMNRRFYAALHDVPFPVIKAQAFTARSQMLRAWAKLPEESDEANRWISKSGPEHYEEHLPRLREWVGEIAP
jgi:mycothiol maleylpyruvate isomerase-like protein